MATPSEILANIFGGQTAKPMSDEERGMAAMGQNPAITTPTSSYSPFGGIGVSSTPTPSPTPPPQVPPAAPAPIEAVTPPLPEDARAAFERGAATDPDFAPMSAPSNVMGVEATKQRLGDIFAGIEGKQPPSIEGMTLREFTAQDPASIAAQQATQAFEAESAAREARLDTMLRDRAMARQSQRGAKPELTAEERQAEAEAQIAEAKAEAARQALQDPNISDYEKFTSELELSDLTPQQKRAATLKRFGLNPLDYPEGGEGVSTAETQDAGSTPATSTVRMRHPDGTLRDVPQEDVDKATEAGYTAV